MMETDPNGDRWAARIRAQHDEAGAECPCGNGVGMKNLMGKSRKADQPYLVFEGSGWTWKVLKSWQGDDKKPYGRWFCDVSSPFTYSGSDLGDTYVYDVVNHAYLTYIDPVLVEAGYQPPKALEVPQPVF